jgi:peptide/nickel transport system permease protein
VFAYILRRLGALFVILFGASFILYNLTAISSDPLEALRTSTDPKAKGAMLALIRELDLNTPPPLRYFKWLKGIFGGLTGHLDFGMSRTGVPVTTSLTQAIPTTIRLITASAIIAIILGISIGIISALRQYSRFDYAMTFTSFLMFSLPVFWVAVLLKQYLAISFNNFLSEAKIGTLFVILASVASGIFWAAVVSGSRKRVWMIFAGTGIFTAIFLEILSFSKWFANPGLGPIGVLIFGVGAAFGVTQLSTGVSNRAALRAALSMSVTGLVLYYPVHWVFKNHPSVLAIFLLGVVTILLGIAFGILFSKIDRGPIIRTAVITGFLVGLITLLDQLMHTWAPYISTDAVNGRPIPTIGQRNQLLPPGNFWFDLLDTIVHLILPTLALLLISFAGYVRYSRGTMLEVLNQDYIRTARAKGLSERTVIMRHAFRNTLIPLTTVIVVDLAGIIGGAIITERVFGWSGMGTLFYVAITNLDLNLLMGVFFVTASLIVLANLVADLLYSVLDPRVRVGAK